MKGGDREEEEEEGRRRAEAMEESDVGEDMKHI